MIRIISAEPLPQYRLKVTFNGGVNGIFPVEPERRGGVFLESLDARVFNAVTVNPDFGCVEWPGGVDLCPDTMHQAMIGESGNGTQFADGFAKRKEKTIAVVAASRQSAQTGQGIQMAAFCRKPLRRKADLSRSPQFAIRNCQGFFSGIHFGMDDWGEWCLAVAEQRDDNSPAIHGWVKRQPNVKVPRGTAERFFRP